MRLASACAPACVADPVSPPIQYSRCSDAHSPQVGVWCARPSPQGYPVPPLCPLLSFQPKAVSSRTMPPLSPSIWTSMRAHVHIQHTHTYSHTHNTCARAHTNTRATHTHTHTPARAHTLIQVLTCKHPWLPAQASEPGGSPTPAHAARMGGGTPQEGGPARTTDLTLDGASVPVLGPSAAAAGPAHAAPARNLHTTSHGLVQPSPAGSSTAGSVRSVGGVQVGEREAGL